MAEVVLVSGVRTAVGRRGGVLAPVRVDDLAALVIREAVQRAAVAPGLVEQVFLGMVNASGEAMGNPGRYTALLAGLPFTTAGMTINHFCGSSLSAVAAATHAIAFGAIEVAVAAGAESMTRSTWAATKPAQGFAGGPLLLKDTVMSGAGGPTHPWLESQGYMIDMPDTAQNLANRYGISRAEADAYALESHRKANAATLAGRFAPEIVPVAVPGAAAPVTTDESIRPDTSLEKLARLRPAFSHLPDITAGNAAPLNDGASAVLLMSAAAAWRAGVRPLARVLSTAVSAVAPAVMGIAPATCIPKAVAAAGLRLDQIDLFELNEAFAVQMLAVLRELPLPPEKLNVNGGALALGHALGNSGTRILVTLLHELARRGGRYGVASLCIGGGQAVTVVIEREEASTG